MAPVGTKLPSSTRDKRKRGNEDNNESGSDASSDSDTGPALPQQVHETASKRVRVIGPSLPPPESIAQAAAASDNNSDTSDDDDDFGPSLPTANTVSSPQNAALTASSASHTNFPPVTTTAPKRDDWMMVPPTGGDWTSRVDPTKIKNRKFNTGKSAKGPSTSSGGASDSWHETPQEKQARLQREMMGIRDNSAKSASIPDTSEKLDLETAKRLQEYNKSRGPSLYESHQSSKQIEKDDDPSARAFDREKDIGGGLQINATQRRDMLKKASDFNSRFSGAKYL